MVMSSDPHGTHDWHSSDYVDDWIGRDVTRDADRIPVLQRMLDLIPHSADAELRVLDVGAGYGVLSQQVLTRFPRARVVCHDYSEPMFAHARTRLAADAPLVEFVVSDLMHATWTADLAGPFDAVVSALAIHNVRHPERVREIYEEIAGLLVPGGCLLNCDHVETLPVAQQLEWLRGAGLERVECFSQQGRFAVFGGFAPAPSPAPKG